MKAIVFCGAIIFLVANFANGATVERRLREGNDVNRKLKSCNVLCSVKNLRRGQTNPQKCYKLQSPNITVSECVYNCLRFKREQLQNVEDCECINGICVEEASTVSSSTNEGTTAASTAPTTRASSPSPPTRGATSPGNSPQSDEEEQSSEERKMYNSPIHTAT